MCMCVHACVYVHWHSQDVSTGVAKAKERSDQAGGGWCPPPTVWRFLKLRMVLIFFRFCTFIIIRGRLYVKWHSIYQLASFTANKRSKGCRYGMGPCAP